MEKEEEKLIKKINEIKTLEEKLKYLENLLKSNENSKLHPKILELISSFKKEQQKKKVSAGEKNDKKNKKDGAEKEKNKKTAPPPLEDLLFRKTESFDTTPAKKSDVNYKTVPTEKEILDLSEPEKNPIEKNEVYKTIGAYKKETNETSYIPRFDAPAYQRLSSAENNLSESSSSSGEQTPGVQLSNRRNNQLESFFGQNFEKDTEEYKRKEIVSKDISFQEEEKETYKRKMRTRFV